MSKPKIRFKGCQGEWERKELGEVLTYEQPGNYIVSSADYINEGTPVLTAGQTFVLGYTDETKGIYKANRTNPVIIFDDFTTSFHWVDFDFKIKSSAMKMLKARSEEVCFRYLYYAMKCIRYVPAEHARQWIGLYSHFSIPIPTLPEQRQIAAYFRSLDGILSGCEARLSSLRRLKEGALQAFFPQQGETQPKIRFKGCQGEWVKKELSECLEISDERNLDGRYKRDDVLSVSDDYGVVNQIELLGRSYAGKTLTNYDVLRTGQIVYTKSPLRSKPYGIVKLNTGKPGIVSSLYAVYNAKPNISADYLHWYFDPAWRLNAYIRPLVNKGAKNTMNISDETALTGYIYIPPTLAEQRLIANFFRTLDRRIELERQRLEKLKQLKAACLEKMFV